MTTNDRTRKKREENEGDNKEEQAFVAITNHEWGSIKNILNGIWDLAVELEVIPTNPLRGMTFPRNIFRIPERKRNETQVYNSVQEKDLTDWCMEKYQEEKDSVYLVPLKPCFYSSIF